MSVDTTLFDELPADARSLVDQARLETAALRDGAERRIEAIRARAEERIDEIQRRADEQVRALREQADQEVRERTRGLMEQLKPLQDAYAREGKLDEALAVRGQIRQLRAQLLDVQRDPAVLTGLQPSDAGRTFLFEVTGRADGMLWGTDVYTADSDLGTAAVHAGVLRDGERGLVRVTVVDGANVDFEGSDRNEVWSDSFGAYPVGYRVARA